MINGVLNINKPKGLTSHNVTKIVRKVLGCKAGHAGTLDPGAEGVLPVCCGTATKQADYLGDEKIYRADIRLGIVTDTEDMDGKVIESNTVRIERDMLEAVIKGFVGIISQTPPMYSAVKQNGVPLYKLARQGKVVERKPRSVTINSIDIVDYDDEKHIATLVIHCGKGTYVRTLCADIGKALGCGACMGNLVRLRSGRFFIENAITLEELRQRALDGTIGEVLTNV
ncbi:MAG: tRNA pseudouridine(55) synthase TruB [Clostridiales bacterium]|jgi:tRNA pseudouridine55 synthase|nr:tRNA pseudouridine(55) synthase TruB [Clostridiales bacterium]